MFKDKKLKRRTKNVKVYKELTKMFNFIELSTKNQGEHYV